MASDPLIYTLAVLAATILLLLILWVCIRYTKDRRARSRGTAHRGMLGRNVAYAAEQGESSVKLACAYQHAGDSEHSGAKSGDVEMQTLAAKEGEVDKAEAWLKRGASRDDLRRGVEEGVLGTRAVKGWDMMGSPTRCGLEGAGRR